MTAKLRSLPPNEVRAHLEMLKTYGVDLSKCAIDIGPNGVKVSPPANQESDIAPIIKRNTRRPKADEKR